MQQPTPPSDQCTGHFSKAARPRGLFDGPGPASAKARARFHIPGAQPTQTGGGGMNFLGVKAALGAGGQVSLDPRGFLGLQRATQPEVDRLAALPA